jgi:hypothetical protein
MPINKIPKPRKQVALERIGLAFRRRRRNRKKIAINSVCNLHLSHFLSFTRPKTGFELQPVNHIMAYSPLAKRRLCKQRRFGQQLGKHVLAATNTHTKIELLLERGCFRCGPCRDVITVLAGCRQ